MSDKAKPWKLRIIAEAEKAGIGWALGLGGMEDFLLTFYAIAFDAGRVAEREECANVCEKRAKERDNYADEVGAGAAFECAELIRARGTE